MRPPPLEADTVAVLTKVANDEIVDEGDDETCNEKDDRPDNDVVIV